MLIPLPWEMVSITLFDFPSTILPVGEISADPTSQSRPGDDLPIDSAFRAWRTRGVDIQHEEDDSGRLASDYA